MEGRDCYTVLGAGVVLQLPIPLTMASVTPGQPVHPQLQGGNKLERSILTFLFQDVNTAAEIPFNSFVH